MKRKIKKILSFLPLIITDYFEWLFPDASENQIRIAKLKQNNFRSYTQLKKHQRNLKIFFAGLFLALLFLLIGLVVGPTLFPEQIESELYIPNGKGDILLGNISKNQATVIFKTLDSANGNKPLATKAIIEVYQDQQYSQLERRTIEDDYAVTHIIPVDSLQEGKLYYIRIVAEDSAVPSHTKVVSSWGDGNEPIKVYTTGELIPVCASPGGDQNLKVVPDEKVLAEMEEKITAPSTKSTEGIQNTDNIGDINQSNNDSSLRITSVMNENYLQPKNKVQTIISWNTNMPSTTVLVYGEGNSKEKREVVIDEQMQKKHAAILTSLKTGSTYYFHAKSIDENGNVALSDEYSLRTPRPQSTITEKIADSFFSIFQQIKPN